MGERVESSRRCHGTSASRDDCRTGKGGTKAHSPLAGTYEEFTERFGSRDLIRARHQLAVYEQEMRHLSSQSSSASN